MGGAQHISSANGSPAVARLTAVGSQPRIGPVHCPRRSPTRVDWLLRFTSEVRSSSTRVCLHPAADPAIGPYAGGGEIVVVSVFVVMFNEVTVMVVVAMAVVGTVTVVVTVATSVLGGGVVVTVAVVVSVFVTVLGDWVTVAVTVDGHEPFVCLSRSSQWAAARWTTAG